MNAEEQKAVTDQLWSDPIGFLKKHHLVYPTNEVGFNRWNQNVANSVAPGTGHRPLFFELRETTDYEVEGVDGKPGRYFYAAPAGNSGLIGYFLPWRSDGGYHLVLGKDAYFFFNALMDGCGFGCIPGPSGSLRVSHHNIQGNDGSTSHGDMAMSLAGNTTILNRNSYRNAFGGSGKCSIIGVRGRLSGWWVVAQRFHWEPSGTLTIDSVERIR